VVSEVAFVRGDVISEGVVMDWLVFGDVECRENSGVVDERIFAKAWCGMDGPCSNSWRMARSNDHFDSCMGRLNDDCN
jgi:hypothetical protein